MFTTRAEWLSETWWTDHLARFFTLLFCTGSGPKNGYSKIRGVPYILSQKDLF